MARGPYSRKQQRFEFAKAAEGAPWAVKKLRDAPTMRVRRKGQKQAKPKPQYDQAKAAIVKAALRRRHG